MKKLFSGMSTLDWILAVGFTVVLALLGNSLFNPGGWLIGIAAAAGLLYLAKRKRDRLQGPPA